MDLVVSTPRFPQAGERIVADEFRTCAGGKGANQAVAAARLGADVDLVGCVGDDGWGGDLRSALLEEGVDVQNVITRPGVPSGMGVVTVLPEGDISVIVAPGADRTLEVDDVERAREVIERHLGVTRERLLGALWGETAGGRVEAVVPAGAVR